VKTGPDAGPFFDYGPLANEKQLERVVRHVGEATQAGTKLWSGGKRVGDKGNWFEPTCLEAPSPDLSMSKEETFGPAFSITVVEDEFEAVRRANDSEYGLTASIWTRDLVRGERVAKALDVGTITVNNTSFTPVIPNAPWSGRKMSGHGATNSHRALAELVQPRFILLDKSKGGELWWFPHDQVIRDLIRAMLGFLSNSIGKKVSALPKMVPLLLKRQGALKKPVL